MPKEYILDLNTKRKLWVEIYCLDNKMVIVLAEKHAYCALVCFTDVSMWLFILN